MATASKSSVGLDAAQRAWLEKMGAALEVPVGDGNSATGVSGGAPGAATAASTATDGKKKIIRPTTGLDPIRPEPQRDEPQPQHQPQPPAPGKRPLLKRGAKGQAVKEMQGLLRKHGATINDDGDFGPKTEAAVKEFQKSKGLQPDGIVGEKTWGALEGDSKAKGEDPVPLGDPKSEPPAQDPVKATPGATGDVTIHGFEEYAVDVGEIRDPAAQEKLRALAHRIVASHQTAKPITAVKVHGHADRDLRLQGKPEAQEKHEMDVSADRAKNALKILVKIIADDEQRPDVAGVIEQNSSTENFGSKHRRNVPPKGKVLSEPQMKENRRVEFFLETAGKPTTQTGNLSVSVVSRDTRQPIPKARVLPVPLFESPPPAPQPTDEKGQVNFDDLPVGKYRVTAQVDDKASKQEVAIREGVIELLTLEIDSDKPPVPPTGTGKLTVNVVLITEVGRLPARNASVRVVNTLNENIKFGPIPTDDKGQVDFDDLPAGKYRVTAQVDSGKSSSGEVAISEGVIELLTLEIASAGPPVRPKNARKAIFTVTNEATNHFIRSAIVTAHGQSEPTGNTGQATLDLPPGEHEFEVTAQGFDLFKGKIKVSTDVETEHHVEMKAATFTGVDVMMVVADTLIGSGIGINASIKMDGFRRTFEADREGIVTIKKVQPGTHEFRVTSPQGFLAKSSSVTITGSESSPHRVVVEMAPCVATVHVTDEAGNDIKGAIVGIGSHEPKTTDDKGKVTFVSVPPGKHKVLVTAKGHEDKSGTTPEFTSNMASDFPPFKIRLTPTNAAPPNGKIENLKGPFDLSKLHQDLKQSQGDVRDAIEAEKAMKITADSEGVDLDKPEEAAKAMTFRLSDDDKDKLKSALFALRNTRHDMNETFHHMQTNVALIDVKLPKLKKRLPEKLTKLSDEDKKALLEKGIEPTEGFFNGLELKHESAREDILHLLDMGEKVIETAHNMEHGPVLAIIMGIVGSDYFKDWIKDEKDLSKLLADKIKFLGEKYNILLEKLEDETLEEVAVLQDAVIQLNNDYENKRKDYDEEHAQFADIIDRLSSGAGPAIPAKFAAVHAAVMKAALLSETAINALPAASKRSANPRKPEKLPMDKAEFYTVYFKQFNPLGKLIFEGSDPAGANRLVFQKEGGQFFYGHSETKHSLQQLAEQLVPVKQLFESRDKLAERYKKWNKVLFE